MNRGKWARTAALAALAPLAAFTAAHAADAVDGKTRITLESAIETALSKNSSLAIARLERQKAFETKREAFGLAMPDLNVSADYRREGKNPEFEFSGTRFKLRPDESYSINARAEQYIYSGAVSSGYRAAKGWLGQAEKTEQAARNDVVTEVKSRFYAVLYTREVIKVHEKSVEQLRSLLKDSKDRQRVGLNTAYDTMRFETRLAEAMPELIAAKNDHGKSVSALLDTLGMDPFSPVAVEGGLGSGPVDLTLEGCVERALENRPELAAAKRAVEAANDAAEAVKSEQMPTLKAFANYNLANSPGLGEATGWVDEWYVGLSMEFNLFDGRERSSRYRKSALNRQIAALDRDRIGRAVRIETKTAYDALMLAVQFVRSQEKSVEYAAETYRIARASNREGVTTQLELLDAQLALTRARLNYTKSLYDYSIAKASLMRSIGEVE